MNGPIGTSEAFLDARAQAKTPLRLSHGGNRGSIPLGSAKCMSRRSTSVARALPLTLRSSSKISSFKRRSWTASIATARPTSSGVLSFPSVTMAMNRASPLRPIGANLALSKWRGRRHQVDLNAAAAILHDRLAATFVVRSGGSAENIIAGRPRYRGEPYTSGACRARHRT